MYSSSFLKFIFLIGALFILFIRFSTLSAQESYEIQVYASEITPKNTTLIELHSNVSPQGPDNVSKFSSPLHETMEITTGLGNNFEIGMYLFNRLNNGVTQNTGSHIRPRYTVPSSLKWNWGVSISVEAGFIKDPFTDKTIWDYEIRPIFDKTMGKHYIAFNPTFDGSFSENEFSFSPNLKYGYKLSEKYTVGIEYYGVMGNPFKFYSANVQTHQFYLVSDIDLNPNYEINIGVGHGITQSSDQWNIKLILGRKIVCRNKNITTKSNCNEFISFI